MLDELENINLLKYEGKFILTGRNCIFFSPMANKYRPLHWCAKWGDYINPNTCKENCNEFKERK
jgi:hypothetical protein